MSICQQASGQVGPDESAASGDNGAFHFRRATTTKTLQPSARNPGVHSRSGSPAFIIRAIQSGQNIGTKPANRRHWTSPPACRIQRTIWPVKMLERIDSGEATPMDLDIM